MIESLLFPLVPERFKEDERYRKGQINIINALPGRRIMGVHIPDMKELAKQLAKRDDALFLLESFKSAEKKEKLYHEEIVVWGLLLNYVKCSVVQRLTLLEDFVPVIDNWAVCDVFCSSAKWFSKVLKNKQSSDYVLMMSFLNDCFVSHREFEVRFAIVMSMCYLLNDDIQMVFSRFDNIDLNSIVSEYGVQNRINAKYKEKMGLAWCLATALAKNPDATRCYMNRCALPDDVKKLYVRKVKESFRTRDVNPY